MGLDHRTRLVVHLAFSDRFRFLVDRWLFSFNCGHTNGMEFWAEHMRNLNDAKVAFHKFEEDQWALVGLGLKVAV